MKCSVFLIYLNLKPGNCFCNVTSFHITDPNPNRVLRISPLMSISCATPLNWSPHFSPVHYSTWLLAAILSAPPHLPNQIPSNHHQIYLPKKHISYLIMFLLYPSPRQKTSLLTFYQVNAKPFTLVVKSLHPIATPAYPSSGFSLWETICSLLPIQQIFIGHYVPTIVLNPKDTVPDK